MSSYQSFPQHPGSSSSAGKLASLTIPPLGGKTFLDVGCNAGYFCGYAFFEAARKIVGIDINEEDLRQARERFPNCDFRLGDWNDLDLLLKPEEKFDVILMVSALHYAKDQEAMISSLMRRLTPDGILILEIGLVEDAVAINARALDTGWYEVERSIDKRNFADWQGIEKLFSPYAYKHGGKSVMQTGDPVPRHVFHLQNTRPVAILLTGWPGSGKSTLARKFSKIFKIIRGDALVWEIGHYPQNYGALG